MARHGRSLTGRFLEILLEIEIVVFEGFTLRSASASLSGATVTSRPSCPVDGVLRLHRKKISEEPIYNFRAQGEHSTILALRPGLLVRAAAPPNEKRAQTPHGRTECMSRSSSRDPQ